MNLKKTAVVLGAGLLFAALWLRWWLQPERQIPRAQARLLSSLERRDFEVMGGMIAADYHDRWGQDRTTIISRSREVFGQFLTLTIGHEPRELREGAGSWVLVEKMTLKGIGGPLAMAARDAVNGWQQPFVVEWRQAGGLPWNWELRSVAHPDLELPP